MGFLKHPAWTHPCRRNLDHFNERLEIFNSEIMSTGFILQAFGALITFNTQ